MLVLHLVPDGVGGLYTLLEFVLDMHAVKGCTYRLGEIVE